MEKTERNAVWEKIKATLSPKLINHAADNLNYRTEIQEYDKIIKEAQMEIGYLENGGGARESANYGRSSRVVDKYPYRLSDYAVAYNENPDSVPEGVRELFELRDNYQQQIADNEALKKPFDVKLRYNEAETKLWNVMSSLASGNKKDAALVEYLEACNAYHELNEPEQGSAEHTAWEAEGETVNELMTAVGLEIPETEVQSEIAADTVQVEGSAATAGNAENETESPAASNNTEKESEKPNPYEFPSLEDWKNQQSLSRSDLDFNNMSHYELEGRYEASKKAFIEDVNKKAAEDVLAGVYGDDMAAGSKLAELGYNIKAVQNAKNAVTHAAEVEAREAESSDSWKMPEREEGMSDADYMNYCVKQIAYSKEPVLPSPYEAARVCADKILVGEQGVSETKEDYDARLNKAHEDADKMVNKSVAERIWTTKELGNGTERRDNLHNLGYTDENIASIQQTINETYYPNGISTKRLETPTAAPAPAPDASVVEQIPVDQMKASKEGKSIGEVTAKIMDIEAMSENYCYDVGGMGGRSGYADWVSSCENTADVAQLDKRMVESYMSRGMSEKEATEYLGLVKDGYCKLNDLQLAGYDTHEILECEKKACADYYKALGKEKDPATLDFNKMIDKSVKNSGIKPVREARDRWGTPEDDKASGMTVTSADALTQSAKVRLSLDGQVDTSYDNVLKKAEEKVDKVSEAVEEIADTPDDISLDDKAVVEESLENVLSSVKPVTTAVKKFGGLDALSVGIKTFEETAQTVYNGLEKERVIYG